MLFTESTDFALVLRYDLSRMATTRKNDPKMRKIGEKQ